MARLFSLIAQQPVDLSISLSSSKRSMALTHGWGLGWYDKSKHPIVKKQKRTTVDPLANEAVHTTIQSNIALMHMRQASPGAISDENTHPFTYNNYMFAHTGSVNKEELLGKLKPPFNTNYQSEPIDSEVLFRYLVQHIVEFGDREGLRKALSGFSSMLGATFVLSDAESLYVYRQGPELYWLSWKVGTPFNTTAQQTGVVLQSTKLAQKRAIVVASEKLNDGNWMVLDDYELFVIRSNLSYESEKII